LTISGGLDEKKLKILIKNISNAAAASKSKERGVE
jgi:hypothetical protein